MPRVRLALQSSSGRVFDVGGIGENASSVRDVGGFSFSAQVASVAEARPVFATAGESKGFIASLERHVSRSSLLISDNSSMGVHVLGLRLLLLLHLLLPPFLLVHLPLVLVVLCTRVALCHPCMAQVIQVVLVASCLCRGPPVTAWTIRGRTR